MADPLEPEELPALPFEIADEPDWNETESGAPLDASVEEAAVPLRPDGKNVNTAIIVGPEEVELPVNAEEVQILMPLLDALDPNPYEPVFDGYRTKPGVTWEHLDSIPLP